MVTMGMWVIAGLFFGVTSNMDLVGQRFDWAGFIWTMVGTMIAGGITVCLVYFAVERVWRSELPVFFPEGGLTEVRALRMTVRRRMLLLFILATTPMLLLGLLSYSLATRLAAAPDPVAWLSQLLRLELILVGGGLMIAIAMAILFSGTLIRPLETLSRRMVAVGQGDLTVRAQVESNDEIGVLSDSFNHTVENLQRRDQELQALYQISQGIASSIELQRTLATLLRNIQPIVPSDTAQVSLVEAGEQLFVRAQLRKNEEEVRYSEEGTSLEEGFGRWIREQRGGLLVADVGQLEAGSPLAAHLATGLPVGSYLGAPLRAGERLIGLIELASGQPSAFDEKNLRLLETIAPQAAGAIDNALQVLERERQLRRQIEQLTIEVDRARRDAQVAQITETEFFQNLQQEAQRIRERKKRASKSDKGPNDRE
jgi:HAMP domain-containing protein